MICICHELSSSIPTAIFSIILWLALFLVLGFPPVTDRQVKLFAPSTNIHLPNVKDQSKFYRIVYFT